MKWNKESTWILVAFLLSFCLNSLAFADAPLKNDVLSFFKRFDIEYEYMLLGGNFWEEGWRAAGGSNYSFNWKLRSQLNVYKVAFYIIPQTAIMGSFATGNISKDLPGLINDFGNVGPVEVTGEGMHLWSIDLCQNIYKHKNTDISLDGLIGFINYEERIRTRDPAAGTDPFLAWNRTYKGLRLGTKTEIPFVLPLLKGKPLRLKASFFYAPDLSMKNPGYDWAWAGVVNPEYSNKGRGTLSETHAGLSFEPFANLFIEVMYNYYKFLQGKSEYTAENIPGCNSHRAKTTLYGPSFAVKYKFR